LTPLAVALLSSLAEYSDFKKHIWQLGTLHKLYDSLVAGQDKNKHIAALLASLKSLCFCSLSAAAG